MYGVEILCVLIVCGGVVVILCVLWWWCSNICVSVVVLVQVLAGLQTNKAQIPCGDFRRNTH